MGLSLFMSREGNGVSSRVREGYEQYSTDSLCGISLLSWKEFQWLQTMQSSLHY